MYLETLTTMTDLAAAVPAEPGGGGGDGLFDWVNNLADDTRTTLINVAKAVIVVGLIVVLFAAKGRLGASIGAIATAALLWFGVGSFDDDGVQDKIDNEVNSAPAVTHEVTPSDAAANDGRISG